MNKINKQLIKAIEFNNLFDDYNIAKYECDKLREENDRIKQEYVNVIAEQQKNIIN